MAHHLANSKRLIVIEKSRGHDMKRFLLDAKSRWQTPEPNDLHNWGRRDG